MSNLSNWQQAQLLAEIELRKRKKNKKLSFDNWLSIVSPSFEWNWRHLIYIREKLNPIFNGDVKKLMLFMPPRHGKSEQVTVRLPAWYLEQNPGNRVIVGAYNQTLANKFSRKTRRIAQERIKLSNERTAVEDWETMAGGGYRAIGVGAGITGMGGNLIIIDDPVKNREEANSETYREKVWDWYTDDLYTRQEPGAAIILIMTRWHQDDLAGRILQSEDSKNWCVVNLPAEAEENDPLGREIGAALCPERYDLDALNSIKSVMGSSYNALFQQRPSAIEGEIFKREWWKYFNPSALPSFKRIIQSWDTGFKTKEYNDYSVCTTWGMTDSGYYLLGRWKGKVEFPELKRLVISLANQYGPHQILIEDKASGQSLIQELQRESSLPIKAIKIDRDKVARAHAVTPEIEAGNVFLPEGEKWLQDYTDVLSAFPNAAHDDDVDSTTQALSELIIFRRQSARYENINIFSR